MLGLEVLLWSDSYSDGLGLVGLSGGGCVGFSLGVVWAWLGWVGVIYKESISEYEGLIGVATWGLTRGAL